MNQELQQMAFLPNATPEQREAAAIHFEIVAAAENVINSVLDLGRKLKRMRDTGGYKVLGFDSLGEYTKAAVNIDQRQAYNYIRVVETLPARLIEENAAAGVTKLALLAQLTPKDREEVAGEGQLANITVTELNAIIREKNGLAEQLTMLQEAKEAAPAVEAKATEIDTEEIRRQAAEETRQQMERAWADERAKLEAAAAEKINSATLAAEKAAAAELRRAKEEAKRKAEDNAKAHIEKARREGAQEAEREQERKYKARLEAAEQARREAEQEAEKARKQLALSSEEEAVEFRTFFAQLGEIVGKMQELADTMREKGKAEEATKYLQALAAGLEEYCKQVCEQVKGGAG